MSARFLLDTNVLSEPMKPRPRAALLRAIEDHRGDLAIAAPSWNELRYGWARMPASRRRDALEDYLERRVRAALPILPYDAAAADWHAAERARLAAKGRTPPHVDGQIAAIAKVNELTLVTRNVGDFRLFDVDVVAW